MKRKLITVLLVLAMVLTVISGCNSSDSTVSNGTSNTSSETTTDATDDGTTETSTESSVRDDVIISTQANIVNGNPWSSDGNSAFIAQLCYDTLMYQDNETGDVEPGLAESYEFNEDATAVIFYLRQGVLFHDGTEMTADDVVYSYEIAMGEAACDTVTSVMESIEKIDDYTVQLNLNKPFASVLSLCASYRLSIISKAYLEEKGDEAFVSDECGTGPYVLVDHVIGETTTFEAFSDYYRGEATIKDVTIKIITDRSVGAVALQNGEIDALLAVGAADYATLKADDSLRTERSIMAKICCLYMNCLDGPTTDVRVRQAIAYCINKEEITIGALNDDAGADYICTQILLKDSETYNYDLVDYEQNIEKAKELLAEAGYEDGIDLTITCAATSTAPQMIATIIQDQCAQAGINITLEVVEYATIVEMQTAGGDYQMICEAPNMPYVDNYSLVSEFIAEDNPNMTGYQNEELFEVIEAVASETDVEQQKEMYAVITQTLLDDVPEIPIMYWISQVSCNKNLIGFGANLSSSLDVYDWYWEE